MQEQRKRSLKEWVAFLGHVEIPVLAQTARGLENLRQDPENLSARGVAHVIRSDPMMTVKLLRYLQQHKHRVQEHEVVVVKQALMMIGMETFFSKVPAQPLVEEVLTGHLEALLYLLGVVTRAHRASAYAMDWAIRMGDMHYEEVRIAALLYDITEILMWCFAPDEMIQIRKLQDQDRTLRSRVAQEQVFGFALVDLQYALATEWTLPGLLITLLDSTSASQPRVRAVFLADNLARHSAKGWDDAALADDYSEIGELLRIPAGQVEEMVAGKLPDAKEAP